MRRQLPVVVLMALVLGGVGATAAHAAPADDPVPAPVYPADPATTLPPPSSQQVDDARQALDRLRRNGSGATPARPPTRLPTTEVAAPLAHDEPLLSSEQWWTLGAGALLVLIASDALRVNRPRGGKRKAVVRKT